jgi:hypothetical protein
MKTKILIALLVLGSSMFVTISHAEIACETARTEWYSHYVQDLRVSWNTSEFVCGGNDNILAETFYDLEKTQFDRTTGSVPEFYQIYKTDVHHIKTQTNMGGDCDAGTLAVSQRWWFHTMTICPDFYTDARVDRASTLAHESRHMERGDPGHVTCQQGALQGRSGACDENFTDGTREGGGYNSDVNYLSAVVNSQIGNELSTSIAQSYLNRYVPDQFNHITAAQVRAFRRD